MLERSMIGLVNRDQGIAYSAVTAGDGMVAVESIWW